MIAQLLASTLALALEPSVLLTVGGDASTGLRTGLDGLGTHAGLALELGGEKNALHLEPRLYAAWVRDGVGVLPGAYLGWTHHYGDGPVTGWTLVGVGGYRSDVLPVLPVLAVSGGVAFGQGRFFARVGPHAFTLPPFFVGGGVEAACGLRL